MTVSVKMSSKNQIVVPKDARDALGLVPGDRLIVTVREGIIRMEKQPVDIEDRLEGSLRAVSEDEDGGTEHWPELRDA